MRRHVGIYCCSAARIDDNEPALLPLDPISGRENLRRRLLAGAQSQGFATELWTCPRVRVLIAERYGVEYHVDHIPRLLRSLGFSPRKPRARSSQRDEAAIDQWVARDWPRLKKRRLDSEIALFSPTKSASS
jgi:hypothetical protein